jgi:hypothetical protein
LPSDTPRQETIFRDPSATNNRDQQHQQGKLKIKILPFVVVMSAVNSWKSLGRESLLVFSSSNVQWKFLRSLGKTVEFGTVAPFPRELSYAVRKILT